MKTPSHPDTWVWFLRWKTARSGFAERSHKQQQQQYYVNTRHLHYFLMVLIPPQMSSLKMPGGGLSSMDVKTWNSSERGSSNPDGEATARAGCRTWMVLSFPSRWHGPEFSRAAHHPPRVLRGRALRTRKAKVDPAALAGHPRPLGAVRPTDTQAGAPKLSDSACPGWSLGTTFFFN